MAELKFVKELLVIDGDIIYHSANDTVLVVLVDEKGNSSEGFVPAAAVNIQMHSSDTPKAGIFDVNSPTSATESVGKPRNVNEKENVKKNTSILHEDDSSPLKSTEKIDENDSLDNTKFSQCGNNDEKKIGSDTIDRFIWSQGTSNRLLNLYNEYFPKVKLMSAMQTKKQMFEKIAKVLNEEFHIDVNGTQCCNHHKSIVRKHKLDQKINRTSGESRRDLEFEEEIEKMKASDDSLEPEVRMGIGQYEHVKKKPKMEKKVEAINVTGESSKCSTNASNSKPRNVADTLLLINERKEEKRDKRHQEKMELLRAILQPKNDQ